MAHLTICVTLLATSLQPSFNMMQQSSAAAMEKKRQEFLEQMLLTKFYNLEEEYADIQTHTITDDIVIEREDIRGEAEKLRQQRLQAQTKEAIPCQSGAVQCENLDNEVDTSSPVNVGAVVTGNNLSSTCDEGSGEDGEWGLKTGEEWVAEDNMDRSSNVYAICRSTGEDSDSGEEEHNIDNFGYISCDVDEVLTEEGDVAVRGEEDGHEDVKQVSEKSIPVSLTSTSTRNIAVRSTNTNGKGIERLNMQLESLDGVNPDLREQDLASLLKEMVKML